MDGSFFPLFEGTIEKIVIESETSGFLMSPQWHGEVRQRLTMRRNGFVSVTRYFIGPPGAETRRMTRYRAKPTEKIMEYISWYFMRAHEPEAVCDAGIWIAQLSNTDGDKWTYTGSMCNDLEVYGYRLSFMTRKVLELPDLWMFDGNDKSE